MNELDRVGDMYSFPPLHSIQSHTLCYFLNWHVLLQLLLMLFLVFLYHFSFSQLQSPHFFLLVHQSFSFEYGKPSQATLPHLCINRAYPYFKQISLFQIISFLVFPLIHLNILILATLILWVYYFLTAQHLLP